MEYAFKKGHLSPEYLYNFEDEARFTNINYEKKMCECPYFCILCPVCDLPAGPSDTLNFTIGLCMQSCVCWKGSCNVKQVLFNVIYDEERRKRDLQHANHAKTYLLLIKRSIQSLACLCDLTLVLKLAWNCCDISIGWFSISCFKSNNTVFWLVIS